MDILQKIVVLLIWWGLILNLFLRELGLMIVMIWLKLPLLLKMKIRYNGIDI